MDSIMQSLESGVEELFTSNRYQEFLKTMAKFHNYSFNNTMLIAMQRPDATLVTSYKNWQSMGRQVMKGEKGITIIAPAPVSYTHLDVENELQSLFEAQYHLNTEGRTETVTETRNVRVGESLGQVVTSGYCNCRICLLYTSRCV